MARSVAMVTAVVLPALRSRLTLPLTRRIEMYPLADYDAVNPGFLWRINADVTVRPPARAGAF
jgi:hypothetical protein